MASAKTVLGFALVLAVTSVTAAAREPRWTEMSTRHAPPADRYRITVWTGERMLVFSPGGGGSFDPQRNRWTPISVEGLPEELLDDWDDHQHRPVLAGDRVVFLYPCKYGSLLEYGSQFVAAIYDIGEDRWTAVPFTEQAPRPRMFPVVAWTGNGLIVWGGAGEVYVEGAGNQPEMLGDGAILDLDTFTWTPMTNEGAPTPRSAATGIWTGSHLFVYGGLSKQGIARQLCHHRNEGRCEAATGGALYDPVSDRWQPIYVGGAPVPRAAATTMMTGDAVIVVGGTGAQGGSIVDGGVYHPDSDRWTPIRGVGIEGARCFLDRGHLVVHGSHHRAAVYDFETGQWRKLDADQLPPTTGWGGSPIGDPGSLVLATPNPKKPDKPASVARIDPVTATWQSAPFPAGAPPFTLNTLSMVWTGEQLLFWGSATREFDPDGSNGCENVRRPCDPVTPTKLVWHAEGVMFTPRFD